MPRWIWWVLYQLYNSIFSYLTPHGAKDSYLINQTELFNKVSPELLKKITKASRRIKYPADTIFIRENEVGDAMYIIIHGEVEIFTQNPRGEKIVLGVYKEGRYFGEQALIGLNKTRKASIRTIKNTTLLKISYANLQDIFHHDKDLIQRLKKLRNTQLISKLGATLSLVPTVKDKLFINLEDKIYEAPKGSILFHYGDPPDFVYVIVDGIVRIDLPENSGKNHVVILKNGMLFGELGVIQDATRRGTATVEENARLIRIPGNEFKAFYQQSQELQSLLHELKNIYIINRNVLVEQFVGKLNELAAITTIYKMPGGRIVMASNALHTDLFMMEEADLHSVGRNYRYDKSGKPKIELTILDNQIVRIKASGHKEQWENLAVLCKALLSKTTISDSKLNEFKITGILSVEKPKVNLGDDEIICTCMSVTRGTIKELINGGYSTIDEISEVCGAATVCCSCRPEIASMLGENPWIPVKLIKTKTHNVDTLSYILKPLTRKFPIHKPGSHIILKAEIDGKTVERTYTISDLGSDEGLRITIKRRDQGLFTDWLFRTTATDISMEATEPQGKFLLDTSSDKPILCIAGGIGITPFIAYAHAIRKNRQTKNMHLIYIAPTKEDFIFTDEFDDILNTTKSVTIEFYEKKKSGVLTTEKLTKIIDEMHTPDIYICGPERLENAVREILGNINYPSNKIFVEKFSIE